VNEVHDATGVLHDRTWRWARDETPWLGTASPELKTAYRRVAGRYRDFFPGGFVAAPIPDFVRNEVSCAADVFGFPDFGFRISRLPFC
jgi:hypothetical protein